MTLTLGMGYEPSVIAFKYALGSKGKIPVSTTLKPVAPYMARSIPTTPPFTKQQHYIYIDTQIVTTQRQATQAPRGAQDRTNQGCP
jgi:hypothetical protein